MVLSVMSEIPAVLSNMAIAGILIVALSVDERIESRGA